MTIHELIAHLKKYDKDARVLVNQTGIDALYHIKAEDGCPGYISIESE